MSEQSVQSSPESGVRASGSLAMALVAPSLLLGPAAQADTSDHIPVLAPVLAQESAADSYNVKRSASGKFTATLVDTPKSVQIIPEQVIRDQAASSLTDVLRNTPGIAFGAGEGGNPLGDRPFIRGYDAQASTYVDGMRDIGATSREVFNLEQVEVTKGAASVYGGRGGAGGSINLISKTAKLDHFTSASLGLGSDSYYRGIIDGNWQLSDTSAFRLNGMYHRSNVAGRDQVNNKRWGIAPTISFGLGTPTRFTLSYYHLSADELPDSGIPYNYPRTGITGPVEVNRRNFYGLRSDFRQTRSDIGTVTVEHDLNDHVQLRNTTRYTHSSQDYVWTQPDDSQGNVANGLVWRRANTRTGAISSVANQTELVGEAQTGSLRHSFNIGIELSREQGHKDNLDIARGVGRGPNNACKAGSGPASGYNCTSLYDPNPGDPWVNRGTGSASGNRTESVTITKSLYAFDTIELSKKWQAGLGLRLDDYAAKVVNPATNGGTTVRRHDTLLNYQFGLVYKPAQNGSIYISYATSSTPANATTGEGSESQPFTGRRGKGLNGADMAPERNRTVEIGTKWDIFNERMTLTAAVFRTQTNNARITLANGDYAMAGKRRVDGLELGLSGSIMPEWNIFSGYTYLLGRLTKNGDGSASADNGNAFPNTPKNSFTLWTTYQPTSRLTLGAGAFHVGSQFGNASNTLKIPSYWRFDAMMAYKINRHLGVQLNVLNLSNKTYYEQAYASHYARMAPGRSAVLNLNLSY